MPKFEYKALTSQGQVAKGAMTEPSKIACIKKIKRAGMTPIIVKQVIEVNMSKNRQELNERKNLKSKEQMQQEKETLSRLSKRRTQNDDLSKKLNSAVNFSLNRGISPRDVRIFTQDFYLLKKAGFNNIHALNTVITNTENPNLKTILEDVLAGVEAGEFMYTTLEYYSTVFPYIYINMIKVGELSGTLEESLKQAVTYLEDKDTLSRKIKKILLPNLFMFVGLIVMTVIAVLFGMPMLENLFDSMGAGGSLDLPAVTLWFAAVCKKVVSLWYVWILILGGITVAFLYWISTPFGRYKFDSFKYRMPIFGKLIYSLDFSKLIQGLYLNMENGMRIQEALEISKNVVKNTVMIATVETAINNIYTGESWIEPFETSGLASPMMTEMLKIGMQTDLPEMLAKLIDYIEVDIENTLEKIIKVLPEVSYLFVGIVLIFFVVAVLVPVISVYMGGWMFDAYGV